MIMNLPGYQESTAFTGDFEQLPVDGYVCQIMKSQIEPWRNGNGSSLVLSIDIAEGEYTKYYLKQYNQDSRKEKRWGGIFRQTVPQEGDNYAMSLRFFKGLITSIENSNPGFTWNMDTETLKGKLIGFVFGAEEYIGQDGEIKTIVKPMQVRTVDKIRAGEYKIPPLKIVQRKLNVGIAESVEDDEIPF